MEFLALADGAASVANQGLVDMGCLASQGLVAIRAGRVFQASAGQARRDLVDTLVGLECQVLVD